MSLSRYLSKLGQYLNSSGLLTSVALDPFAQTMGLKNRIINGDCRIDQRNYGAAIAIVGNTSAFPVDRMMVANYTGVSGNTTVTAQRVAVTDSTVPHDFAVRATVGNTASRGSNYDARFQQNIEGNNVADIVVGNANATPMAVSFWVRGSKAGRGIYQLWGNGLTHSFCKTVAITTGWQKVSIPVPALTAAGNVLAKDNTRGFGSGLYWAGSVYPTTTDGTWATSHATTNFDDFAASGDWIEFTGYQLEKNYAPTSFDYRLYTVEETLCKRYFERVVPSAEMTPISINGAYVMMGFTFKVTKRTNPSMSTNITNANYSTQWGLAMAGYTVSDKSGTVGIGIQSSVDAFGVNLTGATYNPIPIAMRTGWAAPYGSAEFYANAEL